MEMSVGGYVAGRSLEKITEKLGRCWGMREGGRVAIVQWIDLEYLNALIAYKFNSIYLS